MEQVKRILHNAFGSTTWEIAPPEDGQQKECYIAQNESLKVFIKFDVPIAQLQRLAEIAVAPRVLASGINDGKTYVVQDYIAGKYPDRQWFAANLPLFATFIRRYHNDQQLTSLLTDHANIDYHKHIDLDLAQLEAQFRSLNTKELHTPEITSAFEELKNQAKSLQPDRLVPIHADPNTSNMLVTGNALFMIDWDELQLSDSMRDAGLILWWYVAKQHWPDFFHHYGSLMNEALVDRIFWWAARTSFAIALWHAERQYGCSDFLDDFLAALSKKSNPHAVFQDN